MAAESSGKRSSQPLFTSRQSDHGLTLIASKALVDPRMSYLARGVLATGLSSEHQFNKEWILSCGTDDAETVSQALRELLALGYLEVFNQGGLKHYRFTDSPVAESIELAPEPPAAAPQRRQRRSAGASTQLELEDWLEPHRKPLERWMSLRARVHPKLPKEITPRSLTALQYAQERGVLEDFCELASEAGWQSLGFNGHKSYIDKIVQEKHPQGKAKPTMSAINYTLR